MTATATRPTPAPTTHLSPRLTVSTASRVLQSDAFPQSDAREPSAFR